MTVEVWLCNPETDEVSCNTGMIWVGARSYYGADGLVPFRLKDLP